MLSGILKAMKEGKTIEDLNEGNLKEMLIFSNAAASIITTRKGALRVMPSLEEINKLLAM
jgi:fructokinase